MTQFILKIKLGNDAMQTSEDVAEALSSVCSKLSIGRIEGKIMDLNGNSVGEWKFL